VIAGVTALRYLADGTGAGAVRPYATTMLFAVPGAATVTVWALGSHIAQANKPRPLDPIGGST